VSTPISAEHSQYAARLLAMSERVIGAVHDDGPDELLRAIDRALILEPPAGIDPVVALVTVLAAQVDPDTTAEQRIGWTRGYDDPPPAAPRTPDEEADRLVDEVTAGVYPLDELPPRLRSVPVARLTERGLAADEIAARLRCSERAVFRQRGRAS
jgi:DNA-binding NarL/FixJ family response regulator